LADYFGFNMGAVSASLIVTSAQLVVYQGTITKQSEIAIVRRIGLVQRINESNAAGLSILRLD
jgi:hypothetical protein